MRQEGPAHIFSNPMFMVPLYEIRLVSRNVLDGTACFHSTLNASPVFTDKLHFVPCPR